MIIKQGKRRVRYVSVVKEEAQSHGWNLFAVTSGRVG